MRCAEAYFVPNSGVIAPALAYPHAVRPDRRELSEAYCDADVRR